MCMAGCSPRCWTSPPTSPWSARSGPGCRRSTCGWTTCGPRVRATGCWPPDPWSGRAAPSVSRTRSWRGRTARSWLSAGACTALRSADPQAACPGPSAPDQTGSAVHRQHRPGDPRRLGREQECDSGGDVRRTADTTERVLLAAAHQELGVVISGHPAGDPDAGVHQRRAYHVHPHGGELERQRAAERLHPTLGRGIRAGSRLRLGGDRGADRHHRSTGLLQRRGERLTSMHGAEQVHLHLPPLLLRRGLDQDAPADGARAGHQGIHPTMPGADLLGCRRQSVRIGHVHLELLVRPPTVVGAAAAGQAHHTETVCAESLPHCSADAGRTTGDHGDRSWFVLRAHYRAPVVAGSSNSAKCRSTCSRSGGRVARLTTTSSSTPTTAASIAGCQPPSGTGSQPWSRLMNSTSETTMETTATAAVARRQ